MGSGIQFTGVGDLFASLFLAHTATKSSLSEALEYTIATLQKVLQNTLNAIPEGWFILPLIQKTKRGGRTINRHSIFSLQKIVLPTRLHRGSESWKSFRANETLRHRTWSFGVNRQYYKHEQSVASFGEKAYFSCLVVVSDAQPCTVYNSSRIAINFKNFLNNFNNSNRNEGK